MSELYVYLVDQMHVALSKFLSLEDKTPVPKPLTDSAQLKHFAREAEVNEDFELADKYYKEVKIGVDYEWLVGHVYWVDFVLMKDVQIILYSISINDSVLKSASAIKHLLRTQKMSL